MTIEAHEPFEGINIAEALETLNLPEATRDFLRDELEVMGPEAFPDDPLWDLLGTYPR